MIADMHELKAFVAMKIRVFALFGAVAVASFMLLSAPKGLNVLMTWIAQPSAATQLAARGPR